MSRIGKRELTIPTGVNVNVEKNTVTVSGPKGTLSIDKAKQITVKIEDNIVYVSRANEIKHTKQLHGTTNALIANMITGVSEGFQKGLEINGVGYKFQLNGNKLTVNAGYSHPVIMDVPEELTVEAISNTELSIKGIDKALVGQFAAVIRKVREPEPYKGKGIKYKGEVIRRKEGKKAA